MWGCFTRLKLESSWVMKDPGPEAALPCSFQYVKICIILPAVNGLLNSFIWPAYTLYFEEMGWELVRAGLGISVGYGTRVILQQLQVRVGYWLVVPLAIIHLSFAVLSLIYQTSEWAVFAQIVVWCALDTSLAIEGIAFDTFGASETRARQANSTILSVWTFAYASSVGLGGLLYDQFSWTGMSLYHIILQGLMVLLLVTDPACRHSLQSFFRKKSDGSKESDRIPEPHKKETDEDAQNWAHRLPLPEEVQVAGPGLHTPFEDLDDATELKELGPHNKPRTESDQKDLDGEAESAPKDDGNAALIAFTSLHGVGSRRESYGSYASHTSIPSKRSKGSKRQEETGHVIDPNVSADDKISTRRGIPPDLRMVAFCLFLNMFCTMFVYTLEYATFAIFFKVVHNWNEAAWAGLAQMAGDLLGVILMRFVSVFFSGDYDPQQFGWLRRILLLFASKPYTLSFTLATWVLFNAGMLSPVLPVAIAAQIFMGTTYVYSCKWSSEMALYYSLGDSKVFLSLQVLSRNADALAGSIAGVVATMLFAIHPAAPFILGVGLSFLVFVFYTAYFCARVGFGDEIEVAETKRSVRLGIPRVSSWQSIVPETDQWDSVSDDPSEHWIWKACLNIA